MQLKSSLATDAKASTGADRQAEGYGTRGRQTYVLLLLTLIYALSLVDRIAIGIVQEPIKHAFLLSDFQLGLLGGPAFAILYSLLGLPVAQMAERRNRTSVIAFSLALWSVATAACGMAVGYVSLFAARLGVSIGEAGGVPPSQALIVDYFPLSRRTTALSIFGLGVPLAFIISGFGGGWLAELAGWRMTFILLSIPGLLLAVLLKVTVPEPPRSCQFGEATFRLFPQLRKLATNATLWHLTLGASMSCFVGYGLSQYLVSFLMRAHGLSLMQASSFNGVMFGLFAGIGTFGCGYLCDQLAPRFPRVTTWFPAIGMLIAAPLYLAGYLATNLWVAAPFLMLGAMFNYFYVGSMYAAVYAVVPAHLRTLATAVTILFMSLLGYGLGPPIIGLMSDALRAHVLAQSGLSSARCLASPVLQVAKSCDAASASGLRLAIVFSLVGYVWAGLHFLASVWTVRKDSLN
jgi:predicted MFS family arabinose efflux permease